MNYIAASILFLFMSFTLKVGSLSIGLIPTFFGFALALRGVRTLRGDSDFLLAALVTGAIGMPLSFVIYIVEFFGLLEGLPLSVLILAQMFFVFFFTYFIIRVLRHIERAFGVDLRAGKLTGALVLVLAVQGVCALLAMLYAPLRPVCYLATVLIAVLLLYRFLNTRALYMQVFPQDAEEA